MSNNDVSTHYDLTLLGRGAPGEHCAGDAQAAVVGSR
jgi:hypothetical protein